MSRAPPTHADLRRRRFLRTSAAILAAGAGLGHLPVRADEEKPDTEESGAGPARTVEPIFSTAPPGLLLGARESVVAGGDLPTFVKPRAAWNAEPPVQPYVPHTPKGVSLHHTGAHWDGQPPPDRYLRNIQAFHVGPQREWEDIAYHFLVDLEGTVWAGRPPTVRGNPSIYYDPAGLILICFLGDYDARDPSEAQVTAAATTAAWLIRHYKLPSDAITGHRDHAPTTCPGGRIYQLLKDGTFARQVQALLKK